MGSATRGNRGTSIACRGRLGTSKPPARTSVKRKRAALDGGGQGWLSRRTGATKKRRRAYDGFPMEGVSVPRGACLYSSDEVCIFCGTQKKKEREKCGEDSPDMEFAHRARAWGGEIGHYSVRP